MIHKHSFNIEKELAEGSYGNVFSVNGVNGLPSNGSYVYKEYKSYARPNATKLSSFVDFYYDLAPSAKEYLDTICSWPHEVVQDKGTVSGFLMPRIPRKFSCKINFSGGTKNVEAKFEHLLIPDKLLKRRNIPLTNKKRYELLRAIVKDLDFFHEHKICIGDFSHSNILFSLNDCQVFFLDCDSFSIKGSTVFPQTETGNWGVAEQYSEEELGTNKSDIYKLGLLALRLLMNSDNPTFYQATKNTDHLPSNIDIGVRRIIEDSLADATSRPSLAAWASVLTVAIANSVDEFEERWISTESTTSTPSITKGYNNVQPNTRPQQTASANPQNPQMPKRWLPPSSRITSVFITIAMICSPLIFLFLDYNTKNPISFGEPTKVHEEGLEEVSESTEGEAGEVIEVPKVTVEPMPAMTEDELGFTSVEDIVFIDAERVILRLKPSFESAFIADVPRGCMLKRTGIAAEWSRVMYNSQKCYVANHFITDSLPEPIIEEQQEQEHQSKPQQDTAPETNTDIRNDFVFADSDSRLITNSDLDRLSAEQIRIARNELFARRGRVFEKADMKAYFESQAWYSGTVSVEEFDNNRGKYMNSTEIANMETINKYESDHGSN